MNKYTELSDFEINKKVAEYLKLNTIAYERTEIVLFDDMDATPFDPCNNPADAMPIIIENKIGLVPQVSGNLWICSYYPFYVTTNNPGRAAMEVLLMMKDAENEG
ncbi:phage protein NinX family protein [Proteus mirabilis]|uniref:phage protein NinX family protein n=1 Tax=Proteus mirabilis TaxID=584 RepID=UPI0033147AEC